MLILTIVIVCILYCKTFWSFYVFYHNEVVHQNQYYFLDHFHVRAVMKGWWSRKYVCVRVCVSVHPEECRISEGFNPQELFFSAEWYIFVDSVLSFKTSHTLTYVVSWHTAAATVVTIRTVTGDCWVPSAMTHRVRQTTAGTSATTTAARDSVRKIQSGVTMTHQDTAHCLRYGSLMLHYFQLWLSLMSS
jgi:hypothetical protein